MRDVQEAFNEWLVDALPVETPDDVNAYNFNIAETSEAFIVEVIGAPVFDPNNSDWACDEVWSCRPSQFVLSFIDVGSDWKTAESIVVDLVREFLRGREYDARLLRQADVVAVGFVDGDLINVWPDAGLTSRCS